jgi:hypothetical protein
MGASSSIPVVRQQTVLVSPHFSTDQNRKIVKDHIDDLEYQFKNKILRMKKTRELAPLLSSVSDTTRKLKDGLTKNMVIFVEDDTGTFRGIARPAPISYAEMVDYLYIINEDFDKLYLHLGLPLNATTAVLHLTDQNVIHPQAYVEYA